jgi:hypothetical protein
MDAKAPGFENRQATPPYAVSLKYDQLEGPKIDLKNKLIHNLKCNRYFLHNNIKKFRNYTEKKIYL